MRIIDADEVVKFYKNMGKEFPELSVGTHFSIADIISNLDNIPTVKRSRKMTMTNAEWMLKNGMKFSKLSWGYSKGRKNIVYYRKNKSIAIEIYSEKSVNPEPENLITKWLDMEHKEPILDDAEKRYLSAVIKPFRNKVKSISKGASEANREFIAIDCKNGDETFLPWFKAGTMYKGMERYKKYTLEELGLRKTQSGC